MNSADKIINQPLFLWVGKDRITQFVEYFNSIGIGNANVAITFLILVSIAEFFAFVLLAGSLWHFIQKNMDKARLLFFWGTLLGLAIFTFFAVGDQVFGDRKELLEHAIFWVALIMSWRVFTRPS